jgi:spore maturation protein CgeB
LNHIAPGLVSLTREILTTSEIRQPVDLSIIAQSILEDHGIPYRGAIVEYMENKATALRRRYYLDALSGMGLTVFGDAEWGGIHAGPLRACYAGRRLDYQTELPQLYASAKINLNIYHVQCIHAPNPRVYDVLACGGFLLTTYNPGLEDEFEIGRHLDVFHTKEELVEKVHYYLGQESKRREIAQQGQAHVLAKYGYHDRMQTFLHAIVRPEGDGYAYLRG